MATSGGNRGDWTEPDDDTTPCGIGGAMPSRSPEGTEPVKERGTPPRMPHLSPIHQPDAQPLGDPPTAATRTHRATLRGSWAQPLWTAQGLWTAHGYCGSQSGGAGRAAPDTGAATQRLLRSVVTRSRCRYQRFPIVAQNVSEAFVESCPGRALPLRWSALGGCRRGRGFSWIQGVRTPRPLTADTGAISAHGGGGGRIRRARPVVTLHGTGGRNLQSPTASPSRAAT